MAKLRSPNYPSMTLENALARAKRVYDAEHTHPAAREVAVKALGYNSLNGTSLSVLAALTHYGLLEKAGKDTLKVGADAVTAFELDEEHPLRSEALQRLAFNPGLFAELRERFGKELPSDINLKHFLIQQKSFLAKAADEVIRIYRENLELVREVVEPYDGGEKAYAGEQPPMNPQERMKAFEHIVPHRQADGSLRVETVSSKHEFSFPLSFQRDVKATITISGSGKLLRRDLEFLKKKVANLLEGFDDEEGPMIIAPEVDSPKSEQESQE